MASTGSHRTGILLMITARAFAARLFLGSRERAVESNRIAGFGEKPNMVRIDNMTMAQIRMVAGRRTLQATYFFTTLKIQSCRRGGGWFARTNKKRTVHMNNPAKRMP